MKATLILLIALTFRSSFAQTKSNEIAQIKQAVERINSARVYTKKVLLNEAFMPHTTDGGGQLTSYFKNGHLVKIVEWIGLSSCINTTEYYLQNGELIFAYTQGKVFKYEESKAAFNPEIQLLAMEARFYFSAKKVLKCVLKGETICSGRPQKTWATEYEENCKRYKRILSKK